MIIIIIIIYLLLLLLLVRWLLLSWLRTSFSSSEVFFGATNMFSDQRSMACLGRHVMWRATVEFTIWRRSTFIEPGNCYSLWETARRLGTSSAFNTKTLTASIFVEFISKLFDASIRNKRAIWIVLFHPSTPPWLETQQQRLSKFHDQRTKGCNLRSTSTAKTWNRTRLTFSKDKKSASR